jgi:hypothetical protein
MRGGFGNNIAASMTGVFPADGDARRLQPNPATGGLKDIVAMGGLFEN